MCDSDLPDEAKKSNKHPMNGERPQGAPKPRESSACLPTLSGEEGRAERYIAVFTALAPRGNARL